MQSNNTLMITKESTALYSTMDTNSEIVEQLEEGTYVMVTRCADDNWYEVSYRGQTSYIPVDAVSVAEVDVDAITDEITEAQDDIVAVGHNQNNMVDTIVGYVRDSQALLAGHKMFTSFALIAVLAIIALTLDIVITAVKKKKTENDDEE